MHNKIIKLISPQIVADLIQDGLPVCETAPFIAHSNRHIISLTLLSQRSASRSDCMYCHSYMVIISMHVLIGDLLQLHSPMETSNFLTTKGTYLDLIIYTLTDHLYRSTTPLYRSLYLDTDRSIDIVSIF